MKQFDVPIIHKTYELYRALHDQQKTIPKIDRFTLWQRSENAALDILQDLLHVGYLRPDRRPERLTIISAKLDMLRMFLRLAFDVKAINQKRYIFFQEALDEIGRMLGGWIKSFKTK
mgnify:CR=1 FL=1